METTTRPTLTKSEIFRTYNAARKAAKAGKLDAQRVNRALGLLLSKDQGAAKFAEYHTTTQNCHCPDRMRHPHQPCKHMTAKMIAFRIQNPKPQAPTAQASAPVAPSMEAEKTWIETSDGRYMTATQPDPQHAEYHIFWSLDALQEWAQGRKTILPQKATGRRYPVEH